MRSVKAKSVLSKYSGLGIVYIDVSGLIPFAYLIASSSRSSPQKISSFTVNDGTPERAYSGLVEQRDRWRHPEQFIEEKVESGWREATSEEIKDVHSSEFQS